MSKFKVQGSRFKVQGSRFKAERLKGHPHPDPLHSREREFFLSISIYRTNNF